MPSVDIYSNNNVQRAYVRPGRPAITVPNGATVEQVGRGTVQKSGGRVSSPPTGKTRKR